MGCLGSCTRMYCGWIDPGTSRSGRPPHWKGTRNGYTSNTGQNKKEGLSCSILLPLLTIGDLAMTQTPWTPLPTGEGFDKPKNEKKRKRQMHASTKKETPTEGTPRRTPTMETPHTSRARDSSKGDGK